MHVTNGKLVFARKNCEHCDHGQQPSRITCQTCKGTGRGKRGGRGGCQKCHGLRHIWSNDHPQTCTTCNGNYVNFAEEDQFDTLPDAIWQGFTFKVYRHNRPISGNEAILGLGCVFSCGDYGAAWNANDDAALIADVKRHTHHQATKVSKEDGTIANHIGIFVNRGGYSVRPVLESIAEVLGTIASERPEREYIAVATAIAEQGGNGVLGGLYR